MVQKIAGVDVSRETMAELQIFADLVVKWTPKINLIARGSVAAIWDRHIADSVQIHHYTPETYLKWVDIGSGGGFPGIVIAILAKTRHPAAKIILIESDQRKAVFLRAAVRDLKLNASVLAERVEDADPQGADVVSARALSALSGLLPLVDRHLKSDGLAILHKGKRAHDEISQARQSWSFTLEQHASFTDPEARILAIQRMSQLGR